MAIPAASCREHGNLGAGYIEKELLFYRSKFCATEK